jgi:hypothetical protein
MSDDQLPPLADLVRWLADMPPDFRATAESLSQRRPRVTAVVADLFESMYDASPTSRAPDGDPSPSSFLSVFDEASSDAKTVNRLSIVLIATWILWHPAFRAAPPPRAKLEKLLADELAALSALVSADKIGREVERGEELIRRIVRATGRNLAGDTKNEADDRFKQVDSVERQRVLTEAADRERRARKVREAMAKKAAEEAAAKVGRE